MHTFVEYHQRSEQIGTLSLQACLRTQWRNNKVNCEGSDQELLLQSVVLMLAVA
jgi:hypothetical protein